MKAFPAWRQEVLGWQHYLGAYRTLSGWSGLGREGSWEEAPRKRNNKQIIWQELQVKNRQMFHRAVRWNEKTQPEIQRNFTNEKKVRHWALSEELWFQYSGCLSCKHYWCLHSSEDTDMDLGKFLTKPCGGKGGDKERLKSSSIV